MVHPGRRAAVTAALCAGVLAPCLVAPAEAAPRVDVVSESVDAPGALAVSSSRRVFVTTGARVKPPRTSTGTVLRLGRDGRPTRIHRLPYGHWVTGFDVSEAGVMSYVEVDHRFDAAAGVPARRATVRWLRPDGTTRVLADLAAFERRWNPDGDQRYGMVGYPSGCGEAGHDPEYRGAPASMPSGLVRLADGSRVVSDYAGNDLLRVFPDGRVRVLTVLAPHRSRYTSDGPEGCAGLVRSFETSPLDVERGPGGWLYVLTEATSSQNGQRQPELGTGAVWRVHPSTGASRLLYRGLDSARELAVTPDGTVYVGDGWSGTLFRLRSGTKRLIHQALAIGAVEYRAGWIYFTQIDSAEDEIASIRRIRV